MVSEYAMHEKLSIKSDVFSFGVLILEMVTRQKKSLPKWKKYRGPSNLCKYVLECV
jgi:hypothetical protein